MPCPLPPPSLSYATSHYRGQARAGPCSVPLVRALIVAVGGGGDAITATTLQRLLGLHRPAPIMTYAWDRLMIDPLPGPRSIKDFAGLRTPAADVHQVVSNTTLRAPAGSSLPRIAADTNSTLLLLDPVEGAVGMARQIQAAAAHLNIDQVIALDVGGDAVTDGHDPGLRSPLADQLALAACMRSELPTRLLIAAPGLDGEIPAATVLDRLDRAGATPLGRLAAHRPRPCPFRLSMAPVRSLRTTRRRCRRRTWNRRGA